MTGWRGWLLPLAAAVAVVGLVFGVHYAVTGDSEAGPGPDRPRREEAPALPAPHDLTDAEAHLTGYRSTGRRLTLLYRLGRVDCQVGFDVRVVVASESLDTVAVRLQQVFTDGSDNPCDRRRPLRTSVVLSRPPLYRAVRDVVTDRLLVRAG